MSRFKNLLDCFWCLIFLHIIFFLSSFDHIGMTLFFLSYLISILAWFAVINNSEIMEWLLPLFRNAPFVFQSKNYESSSVVLNCIFLASSLIYHFMKFFVSSFIKKKCATVLYLHAKYLSDKLINPKLPFLLDVKINLWIMMDYLLNH
jgi:hypothetical protein